MTSSFEERFNSFSKSQTPENEVLEQSPKKKQIKSSFEDRFNSFAKNTTEEPKEKEKSFLEKGVGIAKQFGLGLLERAIWPYEAIVGATRQPKVQEFMYRQNVLDSIDRLQDAREIGGFVGREEPWNEEDEKTLESLYEQIRNPEKAKEYIQDADLSIRGGLEKLTGQSLHPEGTLEKAANWYGFVKKNPKELINLGTNSKDIIKAIIPGKDISRSLGAGTALQMAEENKFGPLGTIAATIVGDLVGGGVPGLAKAVSQPKKLLANTLAFVSNTKNSIKNDIKQVAQETKFTKDIGTLTNNNMVQMVQARLAGSGLTGKPLENLRKQMTKEIVEEYKVVADELGAAKFQGLHEAGEVAKQGIIKIRDADLAQTRNLYQNADKALKSSAKVDSSNLLKSVKNIEEQLKPGALKSTEQTSVLNSLEKLRKDLVDPKTNIPRANVKDLMNNKIALNDIINYEVQGGAKQLLKKVVGDLDRAIISHGKENIPFVRNYIQANKKFSEHAKTFRNKNLQQLLKSEDPTVIMNKMSSVQGIRDLKKVLGKTPEGKEIFNNLSRLKLDNIVGNNMVDGVSEQLKAGKFANILEKGKNRELVKEILPPQAFKRLENLQKHVGKLAEAAQKFFNSSQSATATQDLATMGSILTGLFGIFTGNPWSLGALSTIGGIAGARQLSKLIADPEFLKLTEEAIQSSSKNNVPAMTLAAEKMVSYLNETAPALIQTQNSSIGE